MNSFEKAWVTSTCAPESIQRVKSSSKGYLNVIHDESKTNRVVVLSNDNQVLAIGKEYQDLLNSPGYTFVQAVSRVANLLELDKVTF